MIEYYISRAATKPGAMPTFTLVKFTEESEETPDNEYNVIWETQSDTMQCNCPNIRRGAHIEDKHCKYVREWLADGEKTDPIVV